MSEPETFEDRFVHDTDDAEDIDEAYDDDTDTDEDYDNLFEGTPAKKTTKRPPTGGCLIGLLKVLLSAVLITAVYFYLVSPEKFATIQNKITAWTSSDKDDAPVLSLKNEKRETQATLSAPQTARNVKIPVVLLRGAGAVPEFSGAAKQNPDLNKYLIAVADMDFAMMDGYHDIVTAMIADWTGTSDTKKAAELLGTPYERFFRQVSSSLLAQTVLHRVGLTPSYTDKLINQDPVAAMAAIYPRLKDAIAGKATVRAQLKTIEPFSSFLLFRCNGDYTCLASWDLFIDMLGMKKYADLLEKTPERIYAP